MANLAAGAARAHPRVDLRMLAAGAAALALAACEGTPFETISLADTEAPMLNHGIDKPLVAVGTRFGFTNPDVQWEVVKHSGDYVVWRDDAGNELLTSYDPFLPAVQWSGPQESGRRDIQIKAGGLFPLAEGNSVAFDVAGQSDRPPSVWRAEWSCTVQAKIEITVPAGKAETWPVLCNRNGREEFLFHFDPTIGHYVQVATFVNGQPTVRQLKTYQRGTP